MIEARDVVKRYDTGGETVVALDGVDVAVEGGEFVSVVGPSGSGKSTLLNVLGLLDVPSEGSVLLDGEPVDELGDRERTRARKRTIGFVFQDFHLVPTLTAQENVEVPRLFDREPEVTAERAADLLSRFGLADRLDHYPNELSGGQKQRVAIARALVNEPSVVLADEPTGNLDQDTGRSILDTFQEICGEGVAVVAVTHDELVTRYTDRTLQLVDGVIDPGASGEMSGSREVAGP
jgi:putative ABC transport system ATP-binding protein